MLYLYWPIFKNKFELITEAGKRPVYLITVLFNLNAD